jgi:hypothetical protein
MPAVVPALDDDDDDDDDDVEMVGSVEPVSMSSNDTSTPARQSRADEEMARRLAEEWAAEDARRRSFPSPGVASAARPAARPTRRSRRVRAARGDDSVDMDVDGMGEHGPAGVRDTMAEDLRFAQQLQAEEERRVAGRRRYSPPGRGHEDSYRGEAEAWEMAHEAQMERDIRRQMQAQARGSRGRGRSSRRGRRGGRSDFVPVAAPLPFGGDMGGFPELPPGLFHDLGRAARPGRRRGRGGHPFGGGPMGDMDIFSALMGGGGGGGAGDDYEALLRLGEEVGEVVPRGASASQIAALPKSVYRAPVGSPVPAAGGSEGDTEDKCSVCLTEFSEGEELRCVGGGWV